MKVQSLGRMLLILAMVTAQGWAASSAASAGTDPYDRLFPYYVELCTIDSFRKKSGDSGGQMGHALYLLKGACKDPASPYPRLRFCDVDDPEYEKGIGLSVQSLFRNVNWVLIESKNFLLRANLDEKMPLNDAFYQAAKQEAFESGMLNHLQAHEDQLKDKPAGTSINEYILDQMVGQDFGVTFGRDAYCSKLPVAKELLPPIIEFLNAQNERYFSGREEYNWNVFGDNCTHLPHNAMAFAGFWKPLKTNKSFPSQLFNLAVPSNEYLDMLEAGEDTPLDDIVWQFRNPYHRNLILGHGWIPTRHGSMAEIIPMHSVENELYENKHDLFILDFPIFAPKTRFFNRIQKTSRYVDLISNLSWFKQEYSHVLRRESSRGPAWYQKRYDHKSDEDISSPQFAEFHSKYLEYIRAQLEDVTEKLRLLGVLQEPQTY